MKERDTIDVDFTTHAMTIYTKSGDSGKTGIVGGKRIAKDDLRIEAIGSIDELNANIGVAIIFSPTSNKSKTTPTKQLLIAIQHTLFNIGSELADPSGKTGLSLRAAHTAMLETEIAAREKNLPLLKNFILPGGPPFAAHLHVTRTVCRRAERRLVSLHQSKKINPELLKYLNRLSDLLFILAREDMERNKIPEQQWEKDKIE